MNHIRNLAAGFLVCASSMAAQAEINRLQNDFTFRRVAVPSGSATNRINVQIDPTSPHRVRPPVSTSGPAEAGSQVVTVAGVPATPRPATGLEWFWAGMSPALSDSKPGRLADALELIRNAPSGKEVPAPRLQTLQQIAQAHGTDILRETVGTNVSPALVLALIAVESAGQSGAESSAGAVGLMQLMPATAERFGVTDRTNPADNIKGGVAYLAWLMKHFDSDPVLVLAGYNAGEGSVRDNAGVPPFAETRAYVPKVLAAWAVARGLCQTTPELISDGCVFSVNGV